MTPELEALGYQLELTCESHPEQYDVFKDGEKVGYLRLRHGFFYAEVPDVGGERVYVDDLGHVYGEFETDDERERVLNAALTAIDMHRNRQRIPEPELPEEES